MNKFDIHKKISVPGILLLFHLPAAERKAATIEEHINSFSEYLEYPVYSLNTEFGFPKNLSRVNFEVIILHYSIFGGWRYYLNKNFLEYLGEASTYKVAFFQDEYHWCKKRFEFINRFQVDSIYTLYEPKYYEQTYRKYTSVKTLKTCLPGYIGDEMIAVAQKYAKPDLERTIDIGYRGRNLPFYMGMGAREKHLIGKMFLDYSKDSNLICDIGIEEADRIYGEKWYQFSGNCKGVLGTESGVSISDPDDTVREKCNEMIRDNPEITFEEISDRVLFPHEKKIPCRTISPRHFEAIMFHNCQLLFPGAYSGVMVPMKHYIPLQKDFSNLKEVLSLFRNRNCRIEMTQRAYLDIVKSGNYTYKKFFDNFKKCLVETGVIDSDHKNRIENIDNMLSADETYRHRKQFLKRILKSSASRIYSRLPGKKYIRSFYQRVISEIRG